MAETISSMFQNLLLWTNEYDSLLTLLFTAVVAVATVVYAFLTWRLVSETIKMRKVQTEPHMSITIEPRNESIGIIDLIVQNIGLGPAYDVTFDIQPDFDLTEKRKLSEIGLFKYGLKYFAPGQKRKMFLTSMYQGYEEKIKTILHVDIKYNNGANSNYTSTYVIDFSELDKMVSVGKPPLYKIASSLDKIDNNIRHLASGFSKLKVINYTEDELRQEDMELFEYWDEQATINDTTMWGKRGTVRYKGSVKEGTQVILKDEDVIVSSLQYQDLLSKFRGKVANIGLPDSRGVIPDDSLGAWLRDNVRRIPLAAYVGPILVKEGYAEEGDDVDLIRFNREYSTDN